MTIIRFFSDYKRQKVPDKRHIFCQPLSFLSHKSNYSFGQIILSSFKTALWKYILNMLLPSAISTEYTGLTEAEALYLLKNSGKNIFYVKQQPEALRIAVGIIREPMFILLVIAALIYFLLGEFTEGYMMSAAIILISGISLFQEMKSSKAMKALRSLSEPRVKVIRNSAEKLIDAVNLVPGDTMILEEGNRIPADAVMLRQNDFSVDESILTGESFAVEKDAKNDNLLYQGTTVASGSCYARVVSTGNNTRLSLLGKTVVSIQSSKSLLQEQTNRFVRRMAVAGLLAFFLIFFINYFAIGDITASLLFSLTVAMSIIPEEIPVAFSSFMALGAYRMSKKGMIVKQPQTVESLGTASVICLDKTGTITENKMQVAALYDYEDDQTFLMEDKLPPHHRVLYYSLLASEISPFDPMEKSIQEAWYANDGEKVFSRLRKIHEYPLSGKPPMMTHVYNDNGSVTVAGKGAVERILTVCRLPLAEQERILERARGMAAKGWRVLGVCNATVQDSGFPSAQDEFEWQFSGLIALEDPPKHNIRKVFDEFYRAGIQLKMITGDFPETALHIAAQTGMRNADTCLTGSAVMEMDDETLRERVKIVNIFARATPEAKLRVVEVLKSSGEIVAMTGDGVNDGPALKAAHIGIAMGNRGTEISRQAADLVIVDDNLEKIIDAIGHGRRIYENLKKAIRYIISIHIPIILIVCIPLVFNWEVVNIFTPIHVIFLELIMGPTCSIFFENEPMEAAAMEMPPRRRANNFFSLKELTVSIFQGLAITFVILLLYKLGIVGHYTDSQIRTAVFVTLIISNVFLTFENRSFRISVFKSIRYPNNFIFLVLGLSLAFLLSLTMVPFIRGLFSLTVLTPSQWVLAGIISLIGVGWLEVYKFFLRNISRVPITRA